MQFAHGQRAICPGLAKGSAVGPSQEWQLGCDALIKRPQQKRLLQPNVLPDNCVLDSCKNILCGQKQAGQVWKTCLVNNLVNKLNLHSRKPMSAHVIVEAQCMH
jgi:hypothetical protein